MNDNLSRFHGELMVKVYMLDFNQNANALLDFLVKNQLYLNDYIRLIQLNTVDSTSSIRI